MATINETGAIKPRHGGALTPGIEARLREQIAKDIEDVMSRGDSFSGWSSAWYLGLKDATRIARGISK